ncbi:MAG: adenylyltransferase/cytidyltransferase family protein [Devosia nanyangense]|uniref:Adenylyltransferase/cytidyltransferase family protein n=1 Tax=Devosia nanyangense TaxID=1228055 RepID=A0A933NW60_9HYPH|nr:adenylyltransferase/cytidyltransferase family protein [Devosia nanyangense]
MKTVLTYGTFDLFHIGHTRLLERARALGDRLMVGISSDEFNAVKGKRGVIPYEHRAEIVGAMRCVDEVFPENDWEQKERDIRRLGADVLVMGDDWAGKFDQYKSLCEVVYLPRTQGISSSELKAALGAFKGHRIAELQRGLDALGAIVAQLDY